MSYVSSPFHDNVLKSTNPRGASGPLRRANKENNHQKVPFKTVGILETIFLLRHHGPPYKLNLTNKQTCKVGAEAAMGTREEWLSQISFDYFIAK